MDYDSHVPRKIAEVLIRKVPDDQQVSRLCVKVCCCFLVVVLVDILLILSAYALCFPCSSWICG